MVLAGAARADEIGAPRQEPFSPQFKVNVGGTEVPVYLARVTNLSIEERQKQAGPPTIDHTAQASFASFDLAGSTEVTVTCHDAVQSAVILPKSSGLTPVVAGTKVTFTVTKPGALTLEVNGEWIKSLEIFVDPPEAAEPNSDDPNVIFYGPGVHEVESVPVHSGQTVYLAPGAVVYGRPTGANPGAAVFACTGDHITVRGRGIIDASLCPRDTRSPLTIYSCRDFRMEGVIVRDSGGFTMPVRRCDGVTIDNVKVFGWRGNSDGMDICNSRDVAITGCFLRTFDDLIVLKTDKGQGVEDNITARHCVLWNEFAHALSLGAELRETVSNVVFADCDIVHDKGREHLLRVYNCDSALVRNVTFDGIRIDEARRVMSLWIGSAVWSREKERGRIENVVFQDITSVASQRTDPLAELVGFDAGHQVQNVVFKNVVIGGKALTPADVRQNEFVRNVSVRP